MVQVVIGSYFPSVQYHTVSNRAEVQVELASWCFCILYVYAHACLLSHMLHLFAFLFYSMLCAVEFREQRFSKITKMYESAGTDGHCRFIFELRQMFLLLSHCCCFQTNVIKNNAGYNTDRALDGAPFNKKKCTRPAVLALVFLR